MKFCILRSGSSGNCTVVEHEDTRVLLDAGGFSYRRLVEILTEAQIKPQSVSGIVVSHLHADHVNASTLRLCREHGIGLWLHSACAPSVPLLFGGKAADSVNVHLFTDKKFSIGGLSFRPFPVMHDAEGVTCGFKFWREGDPATFVTYAADLGVFTDDLIDHFRDAAAIVIESNHDEKMLWANPHRTMHNKQRVIGTFGHLSNQQCGEALATVLGSSRRMPEVVILAHLSGENNSPSTALATVSSVLDEHGLSARLLCAPRDRRMEVHHAD
jgi:phosphoribosyl 1,2-cyclic phosphodiesterase